MKTKKYVLLALLFITLTLAITLGINFMLYASDDHLMDESIVISGIDVGNLTKEQAEIKINDQLHKWLAQPLKLQANGEVVEVALDELDPKVDLSRSLDAAYEIGRKSSIFARTKKATTTQTDQYNLNLSWDEQKLTEALKASLAQFEKEPVDATFKVNEKNLMEILPEQMGQSIDTEALVTQIKEVPLFQDPAPIKVGLQEVKPAVTAADLEAKKIDGLIASYTTWFDPANVERSANVRLAAEALDGALIEPGKVISFNEIVGERTGDKGYQDALIVVNGEFVPGLGGGICQVSSTLYNAGLLANLKIDERTNHGLAVAYVPLGQDATVVYGALDLKFNNSTGGYLLLRSKIGNGFVTIEFYGKGTPGQEVLITNQVEKVLPFETQTTVDPKLAPGTQIIKQHGQNGYVATATRIVKVNGQVVETQSLGRSTYIPLAQIIIKGPELPAKPKPEPKPEPKPDPEQPKPEPETPTDPTPTEPTPTDLTPTEPTPTEPTPTEPDHEPDQGLEAPQAGTEG